MAIKIEKGVSGGLPMTPLIDCVFLLLIFFLVASKLEEEERALAVLLPQASEAQPLTHRLPELVVTIDLKGRYSTMGKVLDDQALFRVLQQAWANNPGRQSVVLRADRRCVWQYVVGAMNLCNKANIRDYRVTTASADSGG
ncbi:MAG: ExbD/TolR family protein [Pirellulales bacterium]|jgi:biopolymer transport protein ExbD